VKLPGADVEEPTKEETELAAEPHIKEVKSAGGPTEQQNEEEAKSKAKEEKTVRVGEENIVMVEYDDRADKRRSVSFSDQGSSEPTRTSSLQRKATGWTAKDLSDDDEECEEDEGKAEDSKPVGSRISFSLPEKEERRVSFQRKPTGFHFRSDEDSDENDMDDDEEKDNQIKVADTLIGKDGEVPVKEGTHAEPLKPAPVCAWCL